MTRFSDGRAPFDVAAAVPVAALLPSAGGAAPPAAGGCGSCGTSYIPTATSFVKSGVIARSVTRIGVRPHVSRCLPSMS